jgi:hypothetical protein
MLLMRTRDVAAFELISKSWLFFGTLATLTIAACLKILQICIEKPRQDFP